MKGIVTVERMRQMEEASNEKGMDNLRLMENAGSAAAAFIRKKANVENRSCVIVAGKGNNGGDGFVVARKLFEAGGRITVILADGFSVTSQSKEMLDRVLRLGIEVYPFDSDKDFTARKIAEADLIVDAVFGTGFHGSLPGSMLPLFRQINQSVAAVFCLDVPSGVSAQSGQAAEGAIRADMTIAFHRAKAGLFLNPAQEYTGQMEEVSIGITDTLGADVREDGFLVGEGDVFSSLPKRQADSHKGDYGRLLQVCGSAGFTGAAILAAMGAARSGVGLLTVAAPSAVLTPLNIRLPEVMTLQLDGPNGMELLLQKLSHASACLIGCGIGAGETAGQYVETVIQNAKCPVVIDADGINCLCGRIDLLQQADVPVILTPHMGEMARLLDVSVEELRWNRFEKLKHFTEMHRVIVVLKDSVTAVFEPSGSFFLNRTGNAGLAKGGSGDLLAGMISGFCAQGIGPLKSAVCAVYLHGLAADRCAKRLSQYGMLPSDILTDLTALFLEHGL